MYGIFQRLQLFWLKKRDPVRYAKKLGVKLGEHCKLNGSPEWGSEPWLISIGNHSEVSFDCAFVTHDGSTWVFREEEKYKNVIRFGRIEIGDNVFIGARSLILLGVSIGDRAIVAAGSVVNKSIPSGEVWGGIPARFICTTDTLAEKFLAETPNYDPNQLKNNKRQYLSSISLLKK